jgi:hypothetical protein
MYGREVGNILESPVIDSACLEYSDPDITISCLLHGLAYQQTFPASSVTWTASGSEFESNVISFANHGGKCQIIRGTKTYLVMSNERTKGPERQKDDTILMKDLRVSFKQILSNSAGLSGCLSPNDTGVYKNPSRSDPYKIVCNGFIVAEGELNSKAINGGQIEIDEGSTTYQIEVGSSSADTFLWIGDNSSTKPATDFWTLDKSFLEMGGSSLTLPVTPLPDKYRGTYQSTSVSNKGRPDFYVTFNEDSYSVSSTNPGLSWTDMGGNFPYDYLVTFDDLVIGRGHNGTDFILSPVFKSVSLHDAEGIHLSTVILGGPSKPSTSSSKSDSGMGPILVVALLLGILWAMK